jgi:hypothetical protein
MLILILLVFVEHFHVGWEARLKRRLALSPSPP